MRKLTIIISLLLLYFCCISQGYGSYVFENDTLAESGNDLLLTSHAVYTMSLTRCQPNAQSCGRINKFDLNLDFIWSLDLPDFIIANENSLHLINDSILIAVGRKNMVDQEEGFYHYTLNTDGEIINFTTHPLPYESNFNYGSLIHNNTLYNVWCY